MYESKRLLTKPREMYYNEGEVLYLIQKNVQTNVCKNKDLYIGVPCCGIAYIF